MFMTCFFFLMTILWKKYVKAESGSGKLIRILTRNNGKRDLYKPNIGIGTHSWELEPSFN